MVCFICYIIFLCCYWNLKLIQFAVGMLFYFVLFSNSRKRKKKIRECHAASTMDVLIFSFSLPQALYKSKRLFSSRSGSTEGGRGHLSHLSMYLIVHPLSVYFPHPISSHGAPPPAAGSVTFTTFSSLPLLPTSTILFCFLIFSQTVVAKRLSLQLYRVWKIFVEITKRKTKVSQYNNPWLLCFSFCPTSVPPPPVSPQVFTVFINYSLKQHV